MGTKMVKIYWVFILLPTIATIVNVRILAEAKKHHFKLTCPNRVPDESPQPTRSVFSLDKQFQDAATFCPEDEKSCKLLSGISGNVNASQIPTSTVYAQFQAAKALVPCDTDDDFILSVFIPKTLSTSSFNPNDINSVAVVYTDPSSLEAIKKWLEEKYAHPSYDNPVRKALTEAGLKKLPYHLDGGTILDKLCPDKPKAILQEKPSANATVEDGPCDGGFRNETRECCSEAEPCNEGQGDCDDDNECRGDLVCGHNNCDASKFFWDSADCCEEAKMEITADEIETTELPAQIGIAINQLPDQIGIETPSLDIADMALVPGMTVVTSPDPTEGAYLAQGAIRRNKRDEGGTTGRIGVVDRFRSFLGSVFRPKKKPFKPIIFKPTSYHVTHPISHTYPPHSYSYPKPTTYAPSYAAPSEEYYVKPDYEPYKPYKKPTYKPVYVDYSHPPKPAYRARVRTRKDFSCCPPVDTNEVGGTTPPGACDDFTEDCKALLRIGKVVECTKTDRFTDLLGDCSAGGSWLDCIEDDESYLRESGFYTNCNNDQKQDTTENTDSCFSDRKRPLDPLNSLKSDDPLATLYPGFDTNKCPVKMEKSLPTYDSPYETPSVNEDEPNTENVENLVGNYLVRYKRSYKVPPKYEIKTEKETKLFLQQATNCRILRSKKGDLRKRCDRIVETRKIVDYQTAISLFPSGSDLTLDEDDFDLLEF